MITQEVWLAVDKDGSEYAYSSLPIRDEARWNGNTFSYLLKGEIKQITGKNMTWKDEPVSVKHGFYCDQLNINQ